MRVAFVTHTLNVGGLESFLFDLAPRLRPCGIEPSFVVTESVGEWHDRPAAEGYHLVSVLPRFWENRLRHVHRVAEALSQFDAVLLNHGFTAQAGLGLLPERVGAISILHNDINEVYAVGLSNADNLDMAVAVSEKVYREALARGMAKERMGFIRNGVQVFSSYPRPAVVPERPLRAVFIGRLAHDQKGVLDLPDIMAMALQQRVSLSLDIVGSGRDEALLREKMARLVSDGLVTFHGALPHSRAMRILLDADVLILPSRYEGQPVTLFEAMARGVVPVVSLLPGITDTVVSHGEDGLLVPVGSTSAVVEELALLDGNRELLHRMSHAAWKSASERFNVEDMVCKYVALLRDVMERRRGTGAPQRSGRIDTDLLGQRPFVPLGINLIIKRLTRRR